MMFAMMPTNTVNICVIYNLLLTIFPIVDILSLKAGDFLRVSFKKNGECVLQGICTLRLGEMICELLNYDFEELHQKKNELRAIIGDISNPESINDLTLEQYSEIFESSLKKIGEYRSDLHNRVFYRYTKDVEIGFALFDTAIHGIKAWIDEMIDSGLGKDTVEGNIKVCKEADSEDDLDDWFQVLPGAASAAGYLYSTMMETIDLFEDIVEKCLISGQPSENMKTFDWVAFHEKALSFVKESAASLAVYYELTEDGELVQAYDFGTLPQYIYHEIMQMILSDRALRRCKHCGRYFIPPNNRPIEYCDSVAPGQTKPCYAIGPMSTYTDKVKADPILEIYTRAYKRYIARRRKGAISPEDFDKWAAFAKAERARAYDENVSPEDFAELLK